LADQKRRFRDRVGCAVREGQLCLDKAAHGKADEVVKGDQFAAADFWKSRRGLLRGDLAALGHQRLVQREAAASSWARAAPQASLLARSSRFQNGAGVFR